MTTPCTCGHEPKGFMTRAQARERAPASVERRLRGVVAGLFRVQRDDVLGRLKAIVSGDVLEKGGEGSGNFGHAGRPGEVGGSGAGGGGDKEIGVKVELVNGKFPKGSVAYHVIPRGAIDNAKEQGLVPGYHGKEEGSVYLFGSKDEAEWYRGVQVQDALQDNVRLDLVVVPVDVGGLRGGPDYTLTSDPTAETTAIQIIDHVDPERIRFRSTKSLTPKSSILSRDWDKQVAAAVRPVLFGVFKAGGDKALKSIRRFPKASRKMVGWMPWNMVAESAEVEVVVKGGEGSGNFGHEGRPGEVGGSGVGGSVERRFFGDVKPPSPADVSSVRQSLRDIAPKAHIDLRLKNDPAADLIASRGQRFEIKDRQFKYGASGECFENVARLYRSGAIDRVGVGYGLSTHAHGETWGRHAWGLKDGVVVETTSPRLELYFGVKLTTAESVQYSKDYFIATKSLKARQGSITIPDWVDDPEVLDALDREMFKFAHGINQTTADALREELIEGMGEGETMDQLADRISELTDEWADGNRAEMIARTESARAYSNGHIEAWRATGVVDRKVWIAAADACPFCLDMNGTVIDLDDNFLDQGDTQDVEWRGQEISMDQDYSDVGGPPLHPQCRCVLVGELAEEKMFVEKGGEGSGNFGHEGRPGEVGGSGPGGGGGGERVLFHGTTSSAVDAILKEGLIPGKGLGADAWAQKHGWNVNTVTVGGGDRSASVFVTSNLRVAERYSDRAAEMSPEGTKQWGVLLEIRVPRGEKLPFSVKRDEEENGIRLIGKVPSEWISYKHNPNWPVPDEVASRWLKKSLENDTSIFYLVVLIEDETETKSLSQDLPRVGVIKK